MFSGVVYMLVRYVSPSGPMCLKCLMLTLSGPAELLVFALCYCCLDLRCDECYVGCLQLQCFLSMCLFVLCVLCLTVLVNCLLNVFAICVGEVNVFSLEVMVLFWVVFFLLANPCIVFQRVCVLCL